MDRTLTQSNLVINFLPVVDRLIEEDTRDMISSPTFRHEVYGPAFIQKHSPQLSSLKSIRDKICAAKYDCQEEIIRDVTHLLNTCLRFFALDPDYKDEELHNYVKYLSHHFDSSIDELTVFTFLFENPDKRYKKMEAIKEEVEIQQLHLMVDELKKEIKRLQELPPPTVLPPPPLPGVKRKRAYSTKEREKIGRKIATLKKPQLEELFGIIRRTAELDTDGEEINIDLGVLSKETLSEVEEFVLICMKNNKQRKKPGRKPKVVT
jgi:hypothetical protein